MFCGRLIAFFHLNNVKGAVGYIFTIKHKMECVSELREHTLEPGYSLFKLKVLIMAVRLDVISMKELVKYLFKMVLI
jgi:hypothetical protein